MNDSINALYDMYSQFGDGNFNNYLSPQMSDYSFNYMDMLDKIYGYSGRNAFLDNHPQLQTSGYSGSAMGEKIGGTAGGLIGSIWGPIGSMAGKEIGSNIGGGIEELARGRKVGDVALKRLLIGPLKNAQEMMDPMKAIEKFGLNNLASMGMSFFGGG